MKIWISLILFYLTTKTFGNSLNQPHDNEHHSDSRNGTIMHLENSTLDFSDIFLGYNEIVSNMLADDPENQEPACSHSRSGESCESFNQTQTLIQELRSQLRMDILKRLGMSTEPKVNKVNMSVQERRQILRLYKKSIEELKEKTSLLLDEDSYYASQFHSYNDNGIFELFFN